MAVTLSKGENVSLSKEAPGLNIVRIGLGWQERETDGEDFDLDASAFLLNVDGHVTNDVDFVFYNNLISSCHSVEHAGDNLTGQKEDEDADAETIRVTLEKVPPIIERITFCVSIHQAEIRQQNFGMVTNAYIRVIDDKNGNVLARYDLSEDASIESAMIFGELYRYGGEWKFRATGQGVPGGLGELARYFGVNVE